jgi:Transposase IS200 like
MLEPQAHAFGCGSRLRRVKPELSQSAGKIMAMRYRSTHKTVHSARYRLVWCTKDPRSLLVGGVDARPQAIIAKLAQRIGAEAIDVEVLHDDVQLLAGSR